jgi:hypothetical protein
MKALLALILLISGYWLFGMLVAWLGDKWNDPQ